MSSTACVDLRVGRLDLQLGRLRLEELLRDDVVERALQRALCASSRSAPAGSCSARSERRAGALRELGERDHLAVHERGDAVDDLRGRRAGAAHRRGAAARRSEQGERR